MLSGCAILLKAVFMLVHDNEPKRVSSAWVLDVHLAVLQSNRFLSQPRSQVFSPPRLGRPTLGGEKPWERCCLGLKIQDFNPEFFRLLYAIAEIASITERIIALLDFISAGQYMIHFKYHFVHSFRYNTIYSKPILYYLFL